MEPKPEPPQRFTPPLTQAVAHAAPDFPTDSRLVTLLTRAATVAAAAVAGLGVVVLFAWWLDIAALKSVLPQWVTMKTNTALGFLLSGLALWLLRDEDAGTGARRAARAGAGLVALLGLLTLAENLTGWNPGIDELLFPEPATTAPTAHPGRMAPATAFNFLFCGLALLLLDTRARRGWRPAQFLVLPPLAVSFIAVMGYLFGAESLYGVSPYSSMALHTALAFAVLGAGVLWARPERGWMALLTSDTPGGTVVWRLVPVVVLVIPFLFWVRLMGERAGYYGTEFGIALMVLANILLITGVAWWSATSLNRKEAERRQSEAQLRKLSLAVEQSPEGIVITDLDANIEYVNAAFLRNTGYRREELIGRNPRLLQSGRTPPENITALWEALTQGRVWTGELVNKRKDGSEYTDNVILTPLRLPDGHISHYVGVQEDITERKRNAEELERHRHHLEERVEERTAELMAARREAERLARSKSEFLANMSHEIRTPLNAILGFARIGVRDNRGRKTEDTCRHILDAGEHLLGVINDILDFSKIEAGKLAVERLPFRLAAIIANARSFVAEAARRKGLACEVETPEGLPEWVLGDAMRLQQILVNLLSNAVKFTQAGEVRLRIAKEGETVHFKVIDTGIGMSGEQLGRLFTPFQQADSSTTRRFGGTGLGLAISRDLAKLLGGGISVESAPGAGSSFTLSLPLPASEAVLSDYPGPAAPARRRLAGLRLLAAEDVEVNRLVLEDLLRHEGAQATFAENGRQVLEHISEAGADVFDLVLMDVQMPEMDGYEATRRLREIAPDLPVIGLTAHAMAEERAKCIAAGMLDHVGKPIDPDALVTAILRHARRRPRTAEAPATEGREPTESRSTAAGSSIGWAALEAQYADRPGFIAKLAAVALRNGTETLAKLLDAMQRRDMQAIAFIAHGIKGMSGNLMAMELHEQAGQTEAAAGRGQAEALPLAEQLVRATRDMLAELDKRTRERDE
jgi:PAS domain S-box-containing protein